METIYVTARDELRFKGRNYRCAVGAGGFTDAPKEGDKATPRGIYPLRECWYRADRVARPGTGLPVKIIQENDGWCDDPTQFEYNRHIKLPYCGSHENLFREENIYDIIVPIGFNDAPVVYGRGSAIFFHLARPDYSPTLGCIAVSLADMTEMLKDMTPETHIAITPEC